MKRGFYYREYNNVTQIGHNLWMCFTKEITCGHKRTYTKDLYFIHYYRSGKGR